MKSNSWIIEPRRAMARAIVASYLLLLPGGPVKGDEPVASPPVSEPLHRRIDRLISAQPDFDHVAAEQATDAEFLRRVHLDLAGIIPTAGDARAFLADPSPDKRVQLVDRLLVSPLYAEHMQRTFDVLLMQRRRDKHVPAAEWQAYLRESFASNKSWNVLVSEILTADGTPERNRAAARFYLDREANVADLVRDVSSIFLGSNLRCAQCHDHPSVSAYKQADFFGLAAFLERTSLFTLPGSGQSVLVEKAEGETTFTSAFTQVRESAGPRLPGGEALAEPQLDESQAYEVAPAEGVRPVPRHSRRAQLAGQLVAHPSFRRNIANRLWAMMMGRGLIEPVDFDHSENPPAHPELLTMLSDELAASNFDLKEFLRQLALTDTYARSSRPPGGDAESPPEQFAVASVKSLSPEQLAWSWLRATGQDAATRTAEGAGAEERLSQEAARIVKVFVTSMPGESDVSEATASQALLLMHGVLHDWLAPRAENLTQRLLSLPDDAVADEMYLSILSRHPDEQERLLLREILAAANPRGNAVRGVPDDGETAPVNDRETALADFAWALLVSPEFRFKH